MLVLLHYTLIFQALHPHVQTKQSFPCHHSDLSSSIPTGEIAPVGPTSFEFMIPEDAPLTISPSVGTVMPGEVRYKLHSKIKTH